MSASRLTPEARDENAATLASTLGIGVQEATRALDLCVIVTSDISGSGIAEEVVSLLGRTLKQVSINNIDEQIAAELIIGLAPPRTNAPKVFLAVGPTGFSISSTEIASQPSAVIPSIFGLIAACYTSGVVLSRVLGGSLPFNISDPLNTNFKELGVDPTDLAKPIDIGNTYLAGAGAIGNGFLWAAKHLNLRGRLTVVDDDCVSSGNLNRQIWFDSSDIGHSKANRLVAHAQPHFPHLRLIPMKCRLQDVPEKSESPWLRRLLVAVDSRRARRALQSEFPREVFDASTTDIREVVLHHHIQPTQNACLSCIYEPDTEEHTREHHIADHLGVTVEDVRTERVSARAATAIAQKFPHLRAQLEGMAYDTLFKQLCAESALTTPEGKRIVAPFAFVSVLAGTLLALELVRRLGNGSSSRNFNYWRLSPWHPPLMRRQVRRPRQHNCQFCSNPLLKTVNDSLWGKESS